MLHISDVTKKYSGQMILDIPSLQLDTGIYWIKGINGSGKTTFLKMIAALLAFDGDITWKSISLKKEPLAYRRQISWAEAEPLYPPFLTGIDLLRFYEKIRKSSPKETDEIVALFNMNDYIKNRVATYSAGMLKKLSLALAFIGAQSLILLDEPFITLDEKAYQCASQYIMERHRTSGTSFLISSHQELDENLLKFDKVLCIADHKIVA